MTVGYSGNDFYQFAAHVYADLQAASAYPGMLAYITDSTVNTLGASVTVGGGSYAVLIWSNATNWIVIGIGGGGSGRTLLTGDTSYYVSTTGSDSNDGSSGSPWATTQHAIDVISSSIDTGGFTVQVNVGAGSFAGFGAKPIVGGGVIFISGAGVSSTTITAGPNDGVFNAGECASWFVPTGAAWCISDCLLAGTSDNSGTSSCIDAYYDNLITLINPYTFTGAVDFSNTASDVAIIFVGNGSNLFDGATSGGSFASTLSGSSVAFLWSDQNAAINIAGTYTVTGTPAWGEAFAIAASSGAIRAPIAISGAATGPRFFVEKNGTIDADFGDPTGTFFPGDADGDIESGGQYAGITDYIGNVAGLPAPIAGVRGIVTDALVATFGSAPTGGGALTVSVYATGATWLMG